VVCATKSSFEQLIFEKEPLKKLFLPKSPAKHRFAKVQNIFI